MPDHTSLYGLHLWVSKNIDVDVDRKAQIEEELSSVYLKIYNSCMQQHLVTHLNE